MSDELDPVSDESLYKTILALFASEDQASPGRLRLGVSNGIVHLAGVTASLESRSRVEELAGSVPGVRGVVNRIEAPGAPSPARLVNLNLQSKKMKRKQ
jgi:osmotically-inducible protein OsmY